MERNAGIGVRDDVDGIQALRDAGSASAASTQPGLGESVVHAVRRYLRDLGDHPPEDMYALILQEVEKPLLREVLRHCDGNQCRAAAALGINRGTLRKKLREYRLA
ncbi:MAG: Fis family transcriptional regulator [Proteobacteria bacterium]|nr:Fis family transcriptional regulator [Pseudomonadota bacterium]